MKNSASKILGQFHSLINYLSRKRWNVTWLIFFAILILLNLMPSENNLEGELTANDFSFTSRVVKQGQSSQIFLADLPIQKLEIIGLKKDTLKGIFQGDSIPAFNQSKMLEFVKKQNNHNLPRLSIKKAGLIQDDYPEILVLKLYNDTRISRLNYDNNLNLLSFCLQRREGLDEQCQSNLGKLGSISSDQTKQTISSLELYLGEETLEVTLDGYQITNPKLDSTPEEIKFDWIPESGFSEKYYEINYPLQITLELPEVEVKGKNIDKQHLLRKRLLVKETRFDYQEDPEDEFHTSAIFQGQVRMAEQDIKIEPSQFLKTEGGKGIQRLYNLQTDSQGFNFLIEGTAQRILTGLNFESPAYSTQGNLWANFLPKEARIALTAFCAAIVSNLLLNLINDYAKEKDNNA